MKRPTLLKAIFGLHTIVRHFLWELMSWQKYKKTKIQKYEKTKRALEAIFRLPTSHNVRHFPWETKRERYCLAFSLLNWIRISDRKALRLLNWIKKSLQTSQLNQKSFQPSQLNQKGCCRDGADNVCWYCRALRLSVFLHFLQPIFLLFCQISDKIKEEENIQNLTLCRLLLQTAKKSASDKWL